MVWLGSGNFALAYNNDPGSLNIGLWNVTLAGVMSQLSNNGANPMINALGLAAVAGLPFSITDSNQHPPWPHLPRSKRLGRLSVPGHGNRTRPRLHGQ